MLSENFIMDKVEERLAKTTSFPIEITKYQKILEEDPNSIIILNKLATLYENQQKLDKANDYYSRILELTPKDTEIHFKVASLNVRQKKFADALRNYQTALNINPDQPAWVFIGLGDALNNTQRTGEAILAFHKAIELKPEYGLVYAKLASALANQGDNLKAIDNYQKAVELQEQLPLWAYINFAKILSKNEQFRRSIDVCQNATKIYPRNSEIKTLLAENQRREGEVVNAISNYLKAIELNPKQPGWLHQNLANLLVENQQYDLAIDHYLQSIKINDNIFSSLPYLDIALSKKHGENHENIIQLSNSNILQKKSELCTIKSYFDLGFLGRNGKTVDPLSYYFINHNIKLVYCSIPKNACTLFKNIIVEYSEDKSEYEKSNQNIHQFLISKRGKVSTLLSCVRDSGYFKIVILRNPFSRLTSGYLDKFAKHINPESFALDVIRDVQQFLGLEINVENSITFEQFIKYLARKKDYELNDHWRPQNNFVGSVKFDLVGQFENLNHVIDILQNNYGIRMKKEGSEHATKYQDFSEKLPFHTMYPRDLRNLEGMPKARQLYSAELEKIVRERYAKDIELYEKKFNVNLDDLDKHL
jgi:tetratricopeptide (TPR) repeat protein